MSTHSESPISHPQSRHVQTFHGTLIDQDPTIIMGLSRLISCQAKSLEQTELPTEITLSLKNGVKIKGNLLPCSMVVFKDRFIRFLLLAWNQAVCNIFLVQFRSDDSVSVEHYQNPRDPTQSHRPEYEVISYSN